MTENNLSGDRIFTFGIYPGGVAGGDRGLLSGRPDCFESVCAALTELQGHAERLVVRCYDTFQDAGSALWNAPCAPADFWRYPASGSRPMDLVLQYRSAEGNVSGYLDFVRDRISQHAHLLYSVQITEEPNFTDGPPVIDGPYPNVCTAVTEGVQAAKDQLMELGCPDVRVGFNCTPTFGPAADFWTRIASGGSSFVEALDYVGLDFFPDVFRAVARDGDPGDLKSSVAGILNTMREVWLPSAGIPERVAIHITEHGWPTSAVRSADRQAEVIEQVIRTVHANKRRLNIGGYSLFALRDVALPSAENEADLFSFFGIMTAIYQRKPAFGTFRNLIQELGR